VEAYVRESALITGFAPGLSSALASRFLSRGFRVAGLSRSGDSARAFAADHAGFEAYACDVTDREAFACVFADFAANGANAGKGGAPSVVVHNASEFMNRDFLESTEADFERIWRTSCLGGVHAAQLALPPMLEAGRGTMIFTGATASIRGGATFSAFASAKFALRGLAQSLARAYGPRGVHVAHVVVDGVIGPGAHETSPVPREKCIDPLEMADTYLELVDQKPSAWSHEIDLRPAGERF